MAGVSRADLFRGHVAASPAAIRPPWALEDAASFAAACDGCGRCAAACPERIIGRDRPGRPAMAFAAGGCTFCGACADACPTGALNRTGAAAAAAPWTLVADVGARCIALSAVECRICGEHCPAGAIRFRPLGGGRRLPEVDAAACTGCGACAGPCPAGVITLRSNDLSQEKAACG
ncbi:ferredoxin-type protein NapF [Azospirillum halopraeferens]|uniref:ferredoxin-type protein NapF n=1 Tax=Azospirillum halopraeferens TaxID=34010 RepID=UPI00040FD846|nr:ferredoxin-type protein NapF [Azospirillum halopraeferens]